ncbi:flagellar basal body rod protein FlgB [Maritalea porphyrae]|uniref:Flagellar basal body rod protein FlgB n=1 Tax=Maritalea porphyrae TaxID=880732 RepID=A0ABQ5UUP6_9HYPH|nr:flagellar basal body rod protein FlgB [Maritalea porphyrae]GLQ18822.1 flagellar basal body rod protein FlgB [Maritalea porphyrae]
MSISKLPLFQALGQKMKWHQTRQSLLAENVANAETPGYRGRDLKPYSFSEQMNALQMSNVSTSATDSQHFTVEGQGAGKFGARKLNSFEITPEGNQVVLEDEMMKVAGNQMDYQAATTLYSRSIKLIRTALGKV